MAARKPKVVPHYNDDGIIDYWVWDGVKTTRDEFEKRVKRLIASGNPHGLKLATHPQGLGWSREELNAFHKEIKRKAKVAATVTVSDLEAERKDLELVLKIPATSVEEANQKRKARERLFQIHRQLAEIRRADPDARRRRQRGETPTPPPKADRQPSQAAAPPAASAQQPFALREPGALVRAAGTPAALPSPEPLRVHGLPGTTGLARMPGGALVPAEQPGGGRLTPARARPIGPTPIEVLDTVLTAAVQPKKLDRLSLKWFVDRGPTFMWEGLKDIFTTPAGALKHAQKNPRDLLASLWVPTSVIWGLAKGTFKLVSGGLQVGADVIEAGLSTAMSALPTAVLGPHRGPRMTGVRPEWAPGYARVLEPILRRAYAATGENPAHANWDARVFAFAFNGFLDVGGVVLAVRMVNRARAVANALKQNQLTAKIGTAMERELRWSELLPIEAQLGAEPRRVTPIPPGGRIAEQLQQRAAPATGQLLADLQAEPTLSQTLPHIRFAARRGRVYPEFYPGAPTTARKGRVIERERFTDLSKEESGAILLHVNPGKIERLPYERMPRPNRTLLNIGDAGAALYGSGNRSRARFARALTDWVDERGRLVNVRGLGAAIQPHLDELFTYAKDTYSRFLESTLTRSVHTKRLMSLIRKGEAGHEWWDHDLQWLTEVFGPDHVEAYGRRFIRLLAATSQGTNTKANVRLAVKAFIQDVLGDEAEGLSLAKTNVQRIRAGEEIGGRKIIEIERGIFGDPDAIPVDRWVARAFNLKSDQPSELPREVIRGWFLTQTGEIARQLGLPDIDVRQAMARLWTAIRAEAGPDADPTSLVGLVLKNPTLVRMLRTAVLRPAPVGFRTPEELVRSVEGGRRFAVITADSPGEKPTFRPREGETAKHALIRRIAEEGFEGYRVGGRYRDEAGRVTEEFSFLVPDMDPKTATRLAREFGQSTVLVNEGLLHQNGTMVPRSGSYLFGPDAVANDFHSVVATPSGELAFTVGLDWSRLILHQDFGGLPLPFAVKESLTSEAGALRFSHGPITRDDVNDLTRRVGELHHHPGRGAIPGVVPSDAAVKGYLESLRVAALRHLPQLVDRVDEAISAYHRGARLQHVEEEVLTTLHQTANSATLRLWREDGAMRRLVEDERGAWGGGSPPSKAEGVGKVHMAFNPGTGQWVFSGRADPSRLPDLVELTEREWLAARGISLEAAAKTAGYLPPAVRAQPATMESVNSLAQMVGAGSGRELARLLPTELNRGNVDAASKFVRNSAAAVVEAARKWGAEPGEMRERQFAAELRRHLTLITNVSGVTSDEALRVLRFRHVMQTGESLPEGSIGQITVDLPALAERLRTADPAQVPKILAEVARPGFWAKFQEYNVSVKLSNPRGRIRDLISNLLSVSTRPLTKLGAAGYEAIAAPLSGRPREVLLGEAPAYVLGTLTHLPTAVKHMVRALVDESFSTAPSRVAQELRQGPAIRGVFGKVVRYPLRLVKAADEVGREMARGGELYARAYRHAAKEGRLTPDRVAELVTRPTDEMAEAVKKVAAEYVFQNQMDRVGRALMESRDKFGVAGRVVVPFMMTAVNIAGFMARHTPGLGLVGTRGLSRAVFAERMGQQFTGAVIGAALYLLAREGYITGSGPSSPSARNALISGGTWRPNSVRVGSVLIPHTNLGPVSPLLTLVGSLAEREQFLGDEEVKDQINTILRGVLSQIQNATFLRTLSALLDLADDPIGTLTRPYSAVADVITGLIPQIVMATAQQIDPTVRDPQSMLEKLMVPIPGLSQRVTPKVDAFGQPAPRQVSPFLPAVYRASPNELAKKVGELGLGLPEPSRTRVRGGKEERIPADEWVRLKERRGRLFADLAGPVILSPDFDTLDRDTQRLIVRRLIARTVRVAGRE